MLLLLLLFFSTVKFKRRKFISNIIMAQSIARVPILPVAFFGFFFYLVGPGGGDLSQNLCPGVGHLSILLDAVTVVPFSIFH